MFKGVLSKAGNFPRAQRRMAAISNSTARRGRSSSRTHQFAVPPLHRLLGEEARWSSSWPPQRPVEDPIMMDDLLEAQSNALGEESARRRERFPLRTTRGQETLLGQSAGCRRGRQAGHYDDVDRDCGDSIIQTKFNELVRVALLKYGPPLPADFVSDNNVVTSSSGQYTDRFVANSNGSSRLSWQEDIGADGKSFMMYDEVGLKSFELLRIIRLYWPSFSVKEDCDGVPFSLLIRNCPYLRAFGGKVQHMRYLRRESINGSSHVTVSIAKYKMREAASQDGIRQGPQPWLYSARMM